MQLVPLTLWIDLPNMFPWRYCVQEYAGILTVLNCFKESRSQLFYLESTNSSDIIVKSGLKFKWKNADEKCIVPKKIVHEGVTISSVGVNDTCAGDSYWTWTEFGQFQWSGDCRKCVESHKFNTPVRYTHCSPLSEDQNIEVGGWVGEKADEKLIPANTELWQQRQNKMRNNFLGKVSEFLFIIGCLYVNVFRTGETICIKDITRY